jgi:CoA:oxalate CoA-transferase
MESGTDTAAAPLAGILVVDLSHVLAGPFCTYHLAMLGARVIKVEMPGAGDEYRGVGPFTDGLSLSFAATNAGKESIALDLKKPADRAILERMLDRADVLVENFRPGAIERLGFGWDVLASRWPRLTLASVSGFGATGPDHLKTAYDVIVQARGGIVAQTGREGDDFVRVGVSIADLVAGVYLGFASCAALFRRERTGRGSRVDVSMLDCMASLLEMPLTATGTTGKPVPRTGGRHPNMAPFGFFKACDGTICIAAGNDRLFAAIAETLGKPGLAEDPRFRTNRDRSANLEALHAEMDSLLAARSVDEWERLLSERGVPVSAVFDVPRMLRDPQLAARNMLVKVEHPGVGPVTLTGNPMKFAGVADDGPTRPAPNLDGDRQSILDWLGMA